MGVSCGYCRGPVVSAALAGRPWPGAAAAAYCCYGCLSLGEQRRHDAIPSPATGWQLGVRLGVGILVVGQSMIFGLALNLHDDVPAEVRRVVQAAMLGGTLLVAVLLGRPLARAAWGELRRGRITLEALFLLTMLGATAASLQAFLTGTGKVYFEVVSVLLVVYTLGKVIGARGRAAALAGARAWAGQLDTCRLVGERGRTRVVPVASVVPGDVIEVNPGEAFAVDGVVRAGTGFVSEAAVSGEPFPVVRRPGDRVLAGGASHDAAFRVEATAKGTERQVDRLLAAVEAARDRPLSLQAHADRVGRVAFPVVVVVALGTFGYWAFLAHVGWDVALFHAMSVLLVACPCALGLATPIVIWNTLGRLAERGVVVRTGDAIERLAGVDRVVFDKTGTLTDDRFALVDVVTAAAGDERAKVLGWVALVEARCDHPVARPFAQLPRPFAAGLEPAVCGVRAVAGCGVEAEIEEADGTRHALRIGRVEWVGGEEPNPPTPFPRKEGGAGKIRRAVGPASDSPFLPREGGGGVRLPLCHRIAVAIDGHLAAIAIVAERLRDSAPAALAAFRRLGLPVEVLTGDPDGRAAALGLPTRAGVLPDDKRAHVAALVAAGGKPLMVGDGINDAAALAAAHVGVALASGTDLAVGAAAVTLYHGDLRALPWAVALSREAVRAVRRNLYRALAYNVVGMALAACGLLHPVVAALLMVASSLGLVFSATRVGVRAGHCGELENDDLQLEIETRPLVAPRRDPGRTFTNLTSPIATRAAVHFAALALQGPAFLLLLEPARETATAAILLVAFTLVAAGLAVCWLRRPGIPHALDMAVGMLTLGNLGMLLGWWADNGFAPLRDGGCAACVEAVRTGTAAPWMWVGMLLGANAAMRWLGRRPLPRGDHVAAMFTGGNVGMLAGMVAGGWVASHIQTESVPLAVAAHFIGMTIGMLAGMAAGTWLAERALAAARAATALPRWLGRGVTRTGG